MGSRTNVLVDEVPLKELPGFAQWVLEDRQTYGIVPITPYRAESLANNPIAEPHDIGLLVAYVDKRCVGYVELMPVLLESGGAQRKAVVLSTFYVHPDAHGTPVGTMLLIRAISQGYDTFVASINEGAERIYEAMRFKQSGPLVYLRIRIDHGMVLSNALNRLGRWLHHRGLGIFRRLALELIRNTVDPIMRPVVIALLMGPLLHRFWRVRARPVSEVASSDDHRPLVSEGTEQFVRTDDVVNWMIQYPWIAEEPYRELDYAFAYRRELFRFLAFELYHSVTGETLGYAVFSVTKEDGRTILKVLDHRLSDERYLPCVARLALDLAKEWSADVIECASEFNDCLRWSPFFLLIREKPSRRFFIYTRGEAGEGEADDERPTRLVLGMCDGDAPFI
jgi:GNAT superfamily N-acetyltransferase